MERQAHVYILASARNGTLYVGVTSDLLSRVHQHRNHLIDGFTKQYDVTQLMWFTECGSIEEAIQLEKKIKNRGRAWKIALIEKDNPDWSDLASDWFA